MPLHGCLHCNAWSSASNPEYTTVEIFNGMVLLEQKAKPHRPVVARGEKLASKRGNVLLTDI